MLNTLLVDNHAAKHVVSVVKSKNTVAILYFLHLIAGIYTSFVQLHTHLRSVFYTSHRPLNTISTKMTVPQFAESWQDKVAWAQAKRSASLAKVTPKLVGVPEWEDMPQNSRDLPKEVLTSREIELTENYTITELLRLLRARVVSVEEVTRAFLRRAALAHAAVRTRLFHSGMTIC